MIFYASENQTAATAPFRANLDRRETAISSRETAAERLALRDE
jgi:hypothetical protein